MGGTLPKLSEQQEKFCRNVVEGMNQSEAYLAAGYKCKPEDARCHASALIAKHNIATRIDALRKQAAERTEVTVEKLTAKLWWVFDRAAEANDLTNARQAAMDIAKLNGKIVDQSRVQSDNVHYTVSDAPMSEEDWEAEYAETDTVEPTARPSGSLN